ncbi:CMRF35-like molecule 9 [Thomomys bottae]
MSGFEGDPLTVRCTYSQDLRKYGKYWCKQGGLLISRCTNTIYTRGDQEVTQDRVSLRDSPQELVLTVTVKHLTLKDAGKYWCGVNILGRDQFFEVSLTVFPGNQDTTSTPGLSYPPPTPSFQPLPTIPNLQHPQPKTKTWRTQTPKLIATVKQGKAGMEATPSPRAPKWPAGPSSYPGSSPQAETSPHTTTSPHAGSSRPAILMDSTTTQDSSLDPNHSSSQPRVDIPMVRMLAPGLVIVSLLLATCLIAFGSHMFRRRKKAPLAMKTQKKDEKVYPPDSALGNGRTPEHAIISLAGPTRPGDSPEVSAKAYKEIQHFRQTAEEEEAPCEDSREGRILAPELDISEDSREGRILAPELDISEDSREGRILAPPLQMSAVEPDVSQFISV